MDDQPYDLIVHASYRRDGRVVVSFHPHNPALIQAIGSLVRDRSGRPKLFPLSQLTQEGLATELAREFLLLKTVIEQNPQLYGVVDLPHVEPAEKFKLSPEAENKVIGLLYELGVDLYDHLFITSESGVLPVIRAIEATPSNGSPFRIAFFSNQVSIPWQLLHPPQAHGQPPEVNDFWGVKYIITSYPEDGGRPCDALTTTLARPSADNTVYVAYTGASGEIVAQYGKYLADSIKKSFALTTLQQPTNSNAFLDLLVNQKDALTTLILYTHGHSGTVVTQDRDGNYIATADVAGSRIDFTQSDSLRVSKLEAATAVLDRTEPFFSRRPLVMLDGCETGATGLSRGNETSFPGIFLDRGAAVVLATEAPLWDQFGYGFADKVIAELGAGNTVGEAIYAARQDFLQHANNPFGLVFTLYGSSYTKYQMH